MVGGTGGGGDRSLPYFRQDNGEQKDAGIGTKKSALKAKKKRRSKGREGKDRALPKKNPRKNGEAKTQTGHSCERRIDSPRTTPEKMCCILTGKLLSTAVGNMYDTGARGGLRSGSIHAGGSWMFWGLNGKFRKNLRYPEERKIPLVRNYLTRNGVSCGLFIIKVRPLRRSFPRLGINA